MKIKAILILFVSLLVLMPAFPQGKAEVIIARRRASGGGGGSALVVQNKATKDENHVAAFYGYDPWGHAVNATGDLLVLVLTSGATTLANGTPNLVCDSASAGMTSGSCASSSLSTWTIGTTTCNLTGNSCITFAYTCSAGASSRYFGVKFNNGSANVDTTITAYDITHNVSSGCLDVNWPSPFSSGTPGATLTVPTSGSYNTAVANEIAIMGMSDDNNCGSSWTGSQGTGWTSITQTTCTSMLGVAEYRIYSSTQSGATATLNTGNSSGNNVAAGVMTFE